MNRSRAFAAFAGVLAVSLSGAAQQSQPLLLSVARVQVKPDRVSEWMEVEKQFTAAYKKGGGTLRAVYRNTLGNPYEFMIVSTMPNYAARDDAGGSPYVKGSSEAEMARLAARRSQCTESVRVTYEKTIPEASFSTPETPPAKMIRITRTSVRSGMAQQYISVLSEEIAPALKKAGVKSFLVRKVEWGGSRNQFTTRSPIEKWAELDGDSALVKSLGRDGAQKLTSKLSGIISYSEWLIYSYVPELSLRASR